MNRALFFDRDGTLIEEVDHLHDPALVRPVPGVAERLRAAQLAGWRLYLHTNQSGIGRGYFTLADAEACNRRMFELLALPRPFDGICIAPEHPGDPVRYRKPHPRFPLEMVTRDRLDPARCWYFGDRTTDPETGLYAGMRGALVATGKAVTADTRAWCAARRVPIYATVVEALDVVLQEI